MLQQGSIKTAFSWIKDAITILIGYRITISNSEYYHYSVLKTLAKDSNASIRHSSYSEWLKANKEPMMSTDDYLEMQKDL